jgi:hypothetical protein
MLDLIIRGGDVVTPQGVVQGDVAVAGETIVAVAAAGVLSAETAKRVVDAEGHIVIPGGIDPHVHLHHVWIKPDGTSTSIKASPGGPSPIPGLPLPRRRRICPSRVPAGMRTSSIEPSGRVICCLLPLIASRKPSVSR